MTEAAPRPVRAERRKPWTYVPEPRPGLADLFAGGEGRARFWKGWVRDGLGDAFDIGMHFALKLAPMDACSDFGAALSRRVMYRRRKGRLQAMRANLRRIRPELDEAGREEIVRLNVESQGRQLVEYAHVTALARHPDRLVVHGLEHLTDALGQGRVILMGPHVSNWELLAVALSPHADLALIHVPPRRRGRRWIADRVRRKAGFRLFTPGRLGTRDILRSLTGGDVLAVFCDEAFENEIRGPLFGRPPHAEGNYATVARLARKTGARICPWHIRRRDDGFRFDLHIRPAIALPPETVRGARLLDDVALLDAALAPLVRDNVDQWYFLDNHLPGGAGKGKGKGGGGRRGPKRAPAQGA